MRHVVPCGFDGLLRYRAPAAYDYALATSSPSITGSWTETTSIGTLRSDDLQRKGAVFRYQQYVYKTVGQHLSNGGMGTVYELERRDENGSVEPVVGKVFHQNYLFQLRTDDVTRRDHHANLAAMARIAALEHPNILPTYVSAPIADNYLFVTPRMGSTLLEAINKHKLTPRARTKLLMQALEGLSCMHQERLIHRDFTLRNILLDDGGNIAYLFDFDLAMSLDDIGQTSYRAHYKGRIFGSPGWSVAPETVDQALMDAPLSTALDIYAIGGALHGLFTDQLLYGSADDMWALLIRIGEGVVVGGKSKVHYPDTVPRPLRPIIEGCLERDPAQRYPRVTNVISDLRNVLRELDDDVAVKPARSTRSQPAVQRFEVVDSVASRASDPSITRDVVENAERAVEAWGYNVQRSLGRVKSHPIFLAVPKPELLENGQFPDPNTFPKLVTVIDLTKVGDPRRLVESWQQFYWPILRKVRQGLLTSLHKVIYDANTSSLLLFSEYVDEPRFGQRLAELDLHVDGALALGFLVVRQVAGLHEHGMAHNNVHPGALLFKGVPETRLVLPAMIGLVEPAMGPEAMGGDMRALAGMILTWLRPTRVAGLNLRIKPMFDAMRTKLSGWAFDKQARPPGVDELMKLVSDALALVDFNFSVLRDSGGDLQEYCLLLLGLRVYHLLWPDRDRATTASGDRLPEKPPPERPSGRHLQ
jgi:serine/threonine protein kinase